ncbi:MAG: Asp-tRNA(Asn)/Glu-tRNA(Gln) amidotransferase subunit GatC [Clostridia bacterium]|jgi:aspartyl-tRNA(Asn)/glutamyl-tRNA(Gln) amidotransferase subunit C|nr:Asp-tRNA(Asn)/Glu-tRNA(Gln) amidotransferase subunit GatC [Clostridia bacterium]
MQVKKEEVLHIANLANLNLEEDQIEEYRENLENILNFANIINNVKVEELQQTITTNEIYNRFRKDEINEQHDIEELLQNAPDKERGMFKIPNMDKK